MRIKLGFPSPRIDGFFLFSHQVGMLHTPQHAQESLHTSEPAPKGQTRYWTEIHKIVNGLPQCVAHVELGLELPSSFGANMSRTSKATWLID